MRKKYSIPIVQEKAQGTITITENVQYNDIEADTVVIEDHVTARLFGKVNTLILKKGACVYIHGIIYGNIVNDGGEIHHFSL